MELLRHSKTKTVNMKRDEFFKTVPARQFFTRYCPDIKNYYHKMRGFDGNKKPIDFTDQEKQQIKYAAAKLGSDLLKIKL